MKSEPMVHSQEIVFARMEGSCGVSTLAIVQIEASREMTRPQVIDAIEAAVTEWVRTTSEGRHAWEISVHDLNIGDLASHGVDGLLPFLRQHGILDLAFLYVGGIDDVVPFDRVLVRNGTDDCGGL